MSKSLGKKEKEELSRLINLPILSSTALNFKISLKNVVLGRYSDQFLATKFTVEGHENEKGDQMSSREITLVRSTLIFNDRECIMLNLRDFQT